MWHQMLTTEKVLRPRPRRTSTLPPTLTSARPPTRASEVARTVVAPPSSVVKCLWGVFVWEFGVLFLSCVCVCRGCCSPSVCVCVCVCDLLIFLQKVSCDSWLGRHPTYRDMYVASTVHNRPHALSPPGAFSAGRAAVAVPWRAPSSGSRCFVDDKR